MTEFTTNSQCFDNTRLSEYKRCPRAFLIRHVLHWTPGGSRDPLVFGSSWHAGLDVVWQHGKKFEPLELTHLAAMAFEKVWQEEGYPLEVGFGGWERFGPRTPGVAKEMYFHYINKRWSMIQESEVLGIEQPFAVPIPGVADTFYVGKLDKTVQYQSQTLVLEHKSTTAYATVGGFRTDYVDSWYASSQVKGYQFGGGLYYPSLDGVWVDAALVHKKIHDTFKFIPVAHNIELLGEWLGNTKTWVSKVVESKRQQTAGIPVHLCFPKNEDSCFGKFGQCEYLDICRTCPDPTKLDGPPQGYHVEMWEPFDLLKLDKLVKESTTNNTEETDNVR